MKKIFLVPLTLLLLALTCEKPVSGNENNDGDTNKPTPEASEEPLNIATFNIRFATSGDTGVKSWASRKAACIASVTDNCFDVVGFQEVLSNQQTDLKNSLKDYDFIFVGRDDGVNGEAVGIGYRKDRLKPVDSGRFWLSPTPDKPSNAKEWGASVERNRVAVWMKFEDEKTNRQFYFLCTHLEVGEENATVRLQSTRLINEREALINTKGLPFFVVGDMNPIAPTEKSLQELRKSFSDTHQESEQRGLREGPIGTYNAFDPNANLASQSKRGDYIFAKGPYDLKKYKVIDTKYNGQYPSDHIPVLITVALK